MEGVKNLISRLFRNQYRAYYIAYTFAFLFVSAIVFSWFYLNKISLIRVNDGIDIYYTRLVYFGQYLRQIIYAFIDTGKLVVPMFEFSYGFGSDLLIMLSDAIGDPLSYLSVFFPMEKTESLYVFLTVFRIFLAGVSFSLYCQYMKKSLFATLCGALIYAFCGFSLILVIAHPGFASPMIYLPLLLIGAEKSFCETKTLFIFMVFLSAFRNFYFFYMMAIFVIIYVAIRLFAMCRENRMKTLFQYLGMFSLYSITGLLMACIVLLPIITFTLSTSRSQSTMGARSVDVLYPLSYYERFASSFITSIDVGHWAFMGYSAVALIAVVLLFTKKKENTQMKIGFLLLTGFLLMPAAGYVLHGFSYPSNRWIFGYSFLVAFIAVVMMQNIFNPHNKQLKVATVFSVLYFIQGLVLKSARFEIFFASNAITFLTVIFMYYMYVSNHADSAEDKKERLMRPRAIILSLIVCSIAIQAFYAYSPNKGNQISGYRAPGVALSMQTENPSAVIRELRDGTFFRFETHNFGGSVVNYNASVLNRQNSINFYHSLGNPYVSEFFIRDMYHFDSDWAYRGLDSRAMPGALASVKYFVANPGLKRLVPYGYHIFKEDIDDGFFVWRNGYALPLGYTYDRTIPESEFLKMSAVEKQQALLQGVVINSAGTAIRRPPPPQ